MMIEGTFRIGAYKGSPLGTLEIEILPLVEREFLRSWVASCAGRGGLDK